jgi:hypothetical protein
LRIHSQTPNRDHSDLSAKSPERILSFGLTSGCLADPLASIQGSLVRSDGYSEQPPRGPAACSPRYHRNPHPPEPPGRPSHRLTRFSPLLQVCATLSGVESMVPTVQLGPRGSSPRYSPVPGSRRVDWVQCRRAQMAVVPHKAGGTRAAWGAVPRMSGPGRPASTIQAPQAHTVSGG